ncbi:MAG: DNA-protecting protein DprA [Bacteroidales bacterium]|nr:DNA-protecting protein DprA [Bacteroidales bacterium]
MKRFEENTCLCALNKIFGFDPKAAHSFLARTGSAEELFGMKQEHRDALLGPYSKYRGLVTEKSYEEAEREMDALSREGIRFSGFTGEDFPDMLKECPDAPLGLYIRSCTPPGELFNRRRNISVIGTRDLSYYGREWCGKIVSRFSESDARPAVVSGLALGTDICAHVAALDSGLPTIAVMATGPEKVYPYRHREFAERIACTPGCALITDYPPGTAPLAIHFLRRNRIIAGMSEATVLVESKIKGGGMMTSRLAFSYDRDVYALPGRADDIRSQGCNLLIKEKIAEPIISVESLAESLNLKSKTGRRTLSDAERIRMKFSGHADEEDIRMMTILMDAIRNERGICLDELGVLAGLEHSRLSLLAGMLEIEGFIHVDLLRRCTACVK